MKYEAHIEKLQSANFELSVELRATAQENEALKQQVSHNTRLIISGLKYTRYSGLYTYLVTSYDMTTRLGYGDIRSHRQL